LTRRLIARHVGARVFELSLRTGNLGFVATPGIAQTLDQRGALGLQVEGMLGDFPLLISRTNPGLGAAPIGHLSAPKTTA